VLACRLIGHRYRFRADGERMSWTCARCGAVGGSKTYRSAADAAAYARAFDREDRSDLGRRAPLVALLPLRIWRAWRHRR
jgi:hypothetical protein